MTVFVPLSQDGFAYFKSAKVTEILFVGAYQSSCTNQKEKENGRMQMQQLLEV